MEERIMMMMMIKIMYARDKRECIRSCITLFRVCALMQAEAVV